MADLGAEVIKIEGPGGPGGGGDPLRNVLIPCATALFVTLLKPVLCLSHFAPTIYGGRVATDHLGL